MSPIVRRNHLRAMAYPLDLHNRRYRHFLRPGHASPPSCYSSYMNFVHSPFCSATALTIHFPKPSIPMSSHEPAISFSKAPSISNIAQFFLKNNFYGLCTLQLNNVTPRIWLAFLSLLKPLPSTLLAGDPLSRPLSVLPWEEISVYFASDLLQSKVVTSSHPDCASPVVLLPDEENINSKSANMGYLNENPSLIKEIKERLGLSFDVEAELWKAANLGDLQDLMIRCLPVFISNLPKSRSINFYSSKEEYLPDLDITST
ncbi:hypothetical protein Ac2012v2_001313 [Leucoagaricus gongylophorus]